jgi:hypothetical protein
MDFLSFKSFISTEVLIIFYYIGASKVYGIFNDSIVVYGVVLANVV